MIVFVKKAGFVFGINIICFFSLFTMKIPPAESLPPVVDREFFQPVSKENYEAGKVNRKTGNTPLHDAIIFQRGVIIDVDIASIEKCMRPWLLGLKNFEGFTPLLLVLKEVLEGDRPDGNGGRRARADEEKDYDCCWGICVIQCILDMARPLERGRIFTDPVNAAGPNKESPIIYLLKRRHKIKLKPLERIASLLCKKGANTLLRDSDGKTAFSYISSDLGVDNGLRAILYSSIPAGAKIFY